MTFATSSRRQLRDSLWAESHRKADYWGSALDVCGPKRVLGIFTQGPTRMDAELQP